MDLGPLQERAASQAALITHAQLIELGYTAKQIRCLVRAGALFVMFRGVYRLVGAPVTWRLRMRAAGLASGDGALIGHRSALAWVEIERAETTVLEVVTDSSHRRRHGGVVAHQTVDLPAADRRRHDGAPVTSVERALIDAGRFFGPTKIGAILDHAVRDGLTTYERFERRVGELGRQGRNGIGTARLVLEARGYGDGFGFEKAMRGLLRDAGLPEPEREFRVHVDGHRYRVDFAFPKAMLGIECDSSRWHELDYQRSYDLARQNRIQNAGPLLMRYTLDCVRDDSAGVQTEIVDAVARRAEVPPGSPSVSRHFPPCEGRKCRQNRGGGGGARRDRPQSTRPNLS